MTRNPAITSSAPATETSVVGRHPGLAALTLGAIGVVYGDIGTSPLYTVKEVFAPAVGVPLVADAAQRRRRRDSASPASAHAASA